LVLVAAHIFLGYSFRDLAAVIGGSGDFDLRSLRANELPLLILLR
jgi:hypothetical protein